jgi:hypothetical protein
VCLIINFIIVSVIPVNLRGKDALIATSDTIYGVERSSDVEIFLQRVRLCVEIYIAAGFNLLVANDYFSQDVKVEVIKNTLASYQTP